MRAVFDALAQVSSVPAPSKLLPSKVPPLAVLTQDHKVPAQQMPKKNMITRACVLQRKILISAFPLSRVSMFLIVRSADRHHGLRLV